MIIAPREWPSAIFRYCFETYLEQNLVCAQDIEEWKLARELVYDCDALWIQNNDKDTQDAKDGPGIKD